MLPATNRGAGGTVGLPDVCLTPAAPSPVPVPYPNLGMTAQAAGFSPTVKVSMMNALSLMSAIPMSMGDEAGSAHPTVKGQVAFTAGNPVVFIDKCPGISLTSPSTGNNMNCPAGAVLVPSAVNVFYTQRTEVADADAAESERQSKLAELREVVGKLDGSQVSGRRASARIGVVCIPAFTADVVRQVHREIAEWGGVDVLVLDLRDNPGGELTAFIDLAREFLPEGSLVASVRDADGDVVEYRSTRPPSLEQALVVRVNEGTASAAELFTRAMQVHGRALVVGRPTYGKRWGTSLDRDGQGLTPRIVCDFAGDDADARVIPDVELDA